MTDLANLIERVGKQRLLDPPLFAEIAAYLETDPDIACPLCGEKGFDASGFLGHIERWCEVAKVSGCGSHNSDFAAALKARLSSPTIRGEV